MWAVRCTAKDRPAVTPHLNPLQHAECDIRFNPSARRVADIPMLPHSQRPGPTGAEGDAV